MKCPICQDELEVVYRDEHGINKLLREKLSCPRAHYSYQYLYGDEKETYGFNVNKVSFCYSAMTTRERMKPQLVEMVAAANRVREYDAEVQKVWNEFWKAGLQVNGRFNAWQVKRALFQFTKLQESIVVLP